LSATVARLYRYPVKGLAAEPVAQAAVARGGGVPGDRRWAIARGGTAYDAAHPVWMRKEAFVMLMRGGDERLAALGCAYEDDGAVLVGTPPEGPAWRADLRTAAGCAEATTHLNALLGPRGDGAARVVPAGSLSLTDIPQNGLSVVNLASVDDFARRVGRPIDPLRFRANVYVEGLPAWAERGWIGRRILIGSLAVHVDAHIERCKATQVDPTTAARDVDTVRLLREHYGHVELGVYAEAVEAGRVAVGDRVTPETAPVAAVPRLRRALFYVKNGWILLRSRLGG
jgi:uncharacterized protein YcbX